MGVNVHILAFSPNGGTRQAAEQLAPHLGTVVSLVKLEVLQNRSRYITIPKDDLVLVVFPVYRKRLPAVCGEVFAHLRAQGSVAVGLLCFGNNQVGQAPGELAYGLQGAGADVLGIVQMSTPHCCLKTQPPGQTLLNKPENLAAVARALHDRLQRGIFLPPLCAPALLENYRPAVPITTSGACTGCGACVKSCPVAAINPDNPCITDTNRCLGCYACINVCPIAARRVDDAAHTAAIERLRQIVFDNPPYTPVLLPIEQAKKPGANHPASAPR